MTLSNENQWLPDDRWIATGHKTVEEMMDRFAIPELVTGLPEELVDRLDRIRQCLRLSYLNYELLDIVLDYALATLELSFKLRYEAHTGKRPGRSKRFVELIEWANEKQLLCGEKEKADFLRNLRNRNVHPRHDSFGGIGFVAMPKMVFEVTNCLFAEKSNNSD